MLVGQPRGAAAPGRPGQKAHLHQIRLTQVFQRDGFLAEGRRQRFQTHRAAVVHLNDGAQQAAVQLIQPQGVHVHPLEAHEGDIPVNDAVAIANDLMKNGTVTDRAQLGITLQAIPSSAAQYYNMPDGAYVNSVNSGSCAEKAGLKAGADLINDIWGLKYDRKVADLIAQYKVPCCLMHNREKAEYNNFLDEFCEDMRGCLSIAKEAGIADDQIILDPGVGFGKNYEHNLTIIHHLERLCDMGYPVLLATSRKSCIGQALDLPTDQRVEGTMVTTVMGVLKGAAFVRVHDVKENLRAIRMTQAILRDGRNG